MSLAKELELYGSECDPNEFREILIELHINLHPSWNVEQLLYHPNNAVRFCEGIRARCGKGLPDEMILRYLQNIRKAGLVPASNTPPISMKKPAKKK